MSEIAPEIVRIRAKITGRVQGVFFRQSTCEQARMLGLAGWVRNMDDGTVEMEVCGPKPKVDALVAWCHEGPPAAKVDAVQIILQNRLNQDAHKQETSFEIVG